MNYNQDDNLVYGRNPVIELLKADQPVDKILVASCENKGSILKIIAMAKEKGIPVKNVSKVKLDNLVTNSNHQNVVAFIAAYEYKEIDDIFDIAQSRNENPFIVILDEIEDPHNMGAIIRTAEVSGAHGIIIPKRRNVGLTPSVMKISAGAGRMLPIVRVSNLTNEIKELQKRGIWVYCLEASGKNWTDFDYKGPMAVVVGSEGRGVSQLVKKTSDFIISLPVFGKINSLNASVAAGVFMYEVVKQRNSLIKN